MLKSGKVNFFIVLGLIAVITYLTFFGFSTKFGDETKVHIKSINVNSSLWRIDKYFRCDYTQLFKHKSITIE